MNTLSSNDTDLALVNNHHSLLSETPVYIYSIHTGKPQDRLYSSPDTSATTNLSYSIIILAAPKK